MKVQICYLKNWRFNILSTKRLVSSCEAIIFWWAHNRRSSPAVLLKRVFLIIDILFTLLRFLTMFLIFLIFKGFRVNTIGGIYCLRRASTAKRKRAWHSSELEIKMLPVSTFCNEFVSEKCLKIASNDNATFRSDGTLPCSLTLAI